MKKQTCKTSWSKQVHFQFLCSIRRFSNYNVTVILFTHFTCDVNQMLFLKLYCNIAQLQTCFTTRSHLRSLFALNNVKKSDITAIAQRSLCKSYSLPADTEIGKVANPVIPVTPKIATFLIASDMSAVESLSTDENRNFIRISDSMSDNSDLQQRCHVSNASFRKSACSPPTHKHRL